MSLEITPIIHGSIMFQYAGLVIHVDPVSRADYTAYPKADLILLTHHHLDHVDKDLINRLKKPATVIVGTPLIEETVPDIVVMKNGDKREFFGIQVEAFPMYNIVRERSPGIKYHIEGEGNAYIMNFGETRVYVAGDTECIPEMRELRNIDIAFIPINLPYTMPPEEAAECVKVFKPKIVYPYHQGKSDPNDFAECLKNTGIEVRVLDLP
jgi:L-ascorbate metabolism protein UlaG (beta-lactamase superfamily)